MPKLSRSSSLLVLSDGLGTALGAMAIYASEGSTGVAPFGWSRTMTPLPDRGQVGCQLGGLGSRGERVRSPQARSR